MRTRRWLLATALTAALNLDTASPADDRKTRSASPTPLSRIDPDHRLAHLDTLFTHRQFDSIRVLVSETLSRAMAEGDSVLVGGLLVARGWVEQHDNRLREAYDTYRPAIEWSRGARDTTRWTEALLNACYCASLLESRAEAIDLCRRALRLVVIRPDPPREARARSGIGILSLYAGDLRTARASYAQALRLYRATGGRLGELWTLTGLGRVYTSVGEIDSARACFQRVWIAATEISKKGEAAHALNNLGTLEHQYGDLSLAIKYYHRAFKALVDAGDISGATVAGSNLALAWSESGRDDEAVAILEELLDTCDRSRLRRERGIVLQKLGSAQLQASRPRAAAASHGRARAMKDTLDVKVRLETARGLADALAAIDSMDAAIAVLNEELIDPVDRDLATVAEARVALARFLASHGAIAAARVEAQRAVRATKSLPPGPLRADALLVSSACYRQAGYADSAATLLQAGVAALKAARAATSEQTGRPYMGDLLRAAEIVLEYPAERPMSDRYESFFDVLEEFRATNRQKSISDPRKPYSERAAVRSLRQIRQEVLEPGDLLLEYFVTDRRTYLLAATRDTVSYAVLAGSRSSLARRVEDYRRVAAQRPDAQAASADDLARLQRALSRELLGPVAGLVADADRLIIVPDGYLHALPFASLPLPDSAASGEPLLEHAAMLLLPSAGVLATAGSRGPDADGGRPFLVVSDEGSLRGVRDEVRMLGKRYAGVVASDGPPTTDELCRRMEDARIIHVAAHIDVSDQQPWFSGIRVRSAPSNESASGVRSSRTETLEILSAEESLLVAHEFAADPYLRAHQVADLSLSADLAVLSGCESALGRLTVGEGVIGLGSAFMQAGVPTVIGSLWQIDDRTTVLLMRAFYDGLADGFSIADALRRAQLELRSRERTAHPYYWAGFVVLGDGRASVALARKPPVGSVLTAGAGLLLLSMALWAAVRAGKRREFHRPL
jgi:CHAT domain-containing protein